MNHLPVYVGEVGVPLALECGIDLSAATQVSIEVRRPDGTTTSWSGVVHNLTAVGYVTAAPDLSQQGSWRLQARIVWPGSDRLGATAVLSVLPRYG